MKTADFSQFKAPFGIDMGRDNSDPIEIRDMTGNLVLSGVPFAAAQAFVRALNGHDKESNALLDTYRRIWKRLPEDVRQSTLCAMYC